MLDGEYRVCMYILNSWILKTVTILVVNFILARRTQGCAIAVSSETEAYNGRAVETTCLLQIKTLLLYSVEPQTDHFYFRLRTNADQTQNIEPCRLPEKACKISGRAGTR